MDIQNERIQQRKPPRSSSRAPPGPRYPPQSFNNSSVKIGLRSTGRKMSNSDIEPESYTERPQTGSLLQDRLREKKAVLQGQRRLSLENDRLTQSSPARNNFLAYPENLKEHLRSSSSLSGTSPAATKEAVGAKATDGQVQKLLKENFDLKLDLYHRQRRQKTLEDKLEAAGAKISQNVELQTINAQLLAELQKRDQAVEEAVGIICALEAKIESLVETRSDTLAYNDDDVRTELLYLQHDYVEDNNDNLPSSPPFIQPDRSPASPKRDYCLNRKLIAVAKMPSFLSDEGNETEALRRLHLPVQNKKADSLASLPKLREDDQLSGNNTDNDGMNSPRLSLLSESSFPSLYGTKSPIGTPYLEARPCTPQSNHLGMDYSTVDYDDNHSRASTPTLPSHRYPESTDSAGKSSSGQFMSLNNVLGSPLQLNTREESSKHAAVIPQLSIQIDTPIESRKYRNLTPLNPSHPFTCHTLPPTPDTISNSTTGSYDAPGTSYSHDVTGLPYLKPFPNHQQNTEQYSHRHSMGETITSRRNGHGWDTTTELSDAQSCPTGSAAGESFDPWVGTAMEREPRDSARAFAENKQKSLQPPEMFSFAALEQDVDYPDDEIHLGRWGRTIVPSATTPPDVNIPSKNKRVYRQMRSRLDETSGSTNDIVPFSREASNPLRSTTTSFIHEVVPEPPRRRSSLSAHTTLSIERRALKSTSHGQKASKVQARTESHQFSAKARLASIFPSRLFRRNQDSPLKLSPHMYSPTSSYKTPASSSDTSLTSTPFVTFPSTRDSNQMYHELITGGTPQALPQGAKTNVRRPSTDQPGFMTQPQKQSMDNTSLGSSAPPPIPRWGKGQAPSSTTSIASRQQERRCGSVDYEMGSSKAQMHLNHKPKYGMLVGRTRGTSNGGSPQAVYGNGGDIWVGDGEVRLGVGVKTAAGSENGSGGLMGERKWFGRGKRGSLIL